MHNMNLQAISSGWTMIKFVLADTLAAVTTTSAKESFIVDCIVCIVATVRCNAVQWIAMAMELQSKVFPMKIMSSTV